MFRLVAFGGVSLILALYLKEIGFDERLIGLFMTFTFLGDLVKSFWLSLITDKVGRRNVLLFSTILMALTGVGLAIFENRWVLIVIATFGIVTPSGSEVGPFRSVEQSSIALLVTASERSDIYAWYTFLGFSCSAIGTIIFGHLVDYLQGFGLNLADSYKATFIAYAVLSFVCVPLAFSISTRIECEEYLLKSNESLAHESDASFLETENRLLESSEHAPLLETPERTEIVETGEELNKYIPNLDPTTAAIVIKLSILFGLDAFASSLVPFSWITYYIKNKFHVTASTLGSIFFVTGIVSGVTSLLSTTFTKRFGPVLTMVGTHLPASFLLTLIPVSSSLKMTLFIMIVRSSTQSMDVAPKHVFLATLVPDNQRTAIFAWVNVIKTFAQLFGPIFVGMLAAIDAQWVTFVIAGSLKVVYDLGMLGTFWQYNNHSAH